MGKCPSCGKEIEYLEGVRRVKIMEEFYWDGKDMDFIALNAGMSAEQEREVEDGMLILLCPLCGKEVGYSEADVKKILKSYKNE